MDQEQSGHRRAPCTLRKVNAVISTKQLIAIFLSLFVIGVSGYVLFERHKPAPIPAAVAPAATTTLSKTDSGIRTIGRSVEGRPIEVYSFGSGKTHLLFVGGMHGGYEWNSVALAYQYIDYLNKDPAHVPQGMTISVIPSANPDGLYAIVKKEGRFNERDIPPGANDAGVGRLNAHDVDLNRNFGCNWKPKSTWKGKIVSAGTAPFSEPESTTLRDFIHQDKPSAVIFWHSQSGSVYASQCSGGILPDTLILMDRYAKAAGYTPVKKFDAYPITGDSEGWLAAEGIPAITVELKTHHTVEWEENLAGINAFLGFFATKK
jgi:predicted deacylase